MAGIQAIRGCGEAGCAPSARTDLFCDDGKFLPMAGAGNAGRVVLTLLWTGALCASFPTSASLNSAYPVYLAIAALGAIYLGLSLRHFRAQGTLGVLAWIACATAVPAVEKWGHATSSVVATAATTTTLAAWVLSFVGFAGRPNNNKPAKFAGSLFIACLGLAAACGIGIELLAAPGHTTFFNYPADARLPLRVVAFLALIAAAIVPVLGGFGRAIGGSDNGSERKQRFKPKWHLEDFVPPRGSGRTRSARDPFAIVGLVVTVFAEAAWLAIRWIVAITGRVLLLLVYAAYRVFFWLVNFLWDWVHGFGLIIRQGFGLLGQALRRSLRAVVVPLAALLAAAYAASAFARNDLTYLESGSLSALWSAVAQIVGATLALAVAWIALSGEPIGPSVRSAAVSIGYFGAWLIIVAAMGGWVVGLYGVFGPGPIRFGWVTYGATALVALIGLTQFARNRGVAVNEPNAATPAAVAPSAAVLSGRSTVATWSSAAATASQKPEGHPVVLTLLIVLLAAGGSGGWWYEHQQDVQKREAAQVAELAQCIAGYWTFTADQYITYTNGDPAVTQHLTGGHLEFVDGVARQYYDADGTVSDGKTTQSAPEAGLPLAANPSSSPYRFDGSTITYTDTTWGTEKATCSGDSSTLTGEHNGGSAYGRYTITLTRATPPTAQP